MNQGQSDTTPIKTLGIVAAGVSIGAKVHANQHGRRFPFWLFDLFCGSGYNDQVDCIGSPIAMYEEAIRLGVAPLMHCVDRDPEAIAALSERELVAANFNKSIWLHNGDNKQFDVMAESRVRERENPLFAQGIALFDPNDSVISLDLLAGFSKLLPRIDIVINYSGAAIKRANGAGAKRPDLNAYIKAANKKHWLIRRPIGKWQWSLVVGRNFETRNYRALGFEHLHDSSGQAALQTLVMTKAESDKANAASQSPLGF